MAVLARRGWIRRRTWAGWRRRWSCTVSRQSRRGYSLASRSVEKHIRLWEAQLNPDPPSGAVGPFVINQTAEEHRLVRSLVDSFVGPSVPFVGPSVGPLVSSLVCRSVGLSVCRSVGPSVRRSFFFFFSGFCFLALLRNHIIVVYSNKTCFLMFVFPGFFHLHRESVLRIGVWRSDTCCFRVSVECRRETARECCHRKHAIRDDFGREQGDVSLPCGGAGRHKDAAGQSEGSTVA